MIASIAANGHQQFGQMKLIEYLVNQRLCFSNPLLIFNMVEKMTDRRPLNPNVTVPKPGGGEQPRSRNNDGQVRDKRSDAGKPKKK